jgi:hypothetical protein
MEAMAIQRGLYLANQVGCNKLIIQSECLEVIEILQNGGYTASAAAPIIDDMCIQVSYFSRVEFVSCTRESNSVAHSLAKECGTQPGVWFEDPPSFIVSLLIDYVSVI